MSKLAVTLLLLMVMGPMMRAQMLTVRDGRLVNNRGEKILLRGASLEGWMMLTGVKPDSVDFSTFMKQLDELAGPGQSEKFYRRWMTNYIRPIDISSLGVWGFNAVRLPLRADLFVDSTSNNAGAAWAFSATDSIVQWCSRNRLYVFLELENVPGEISPEQLTVLWKNFARRYAHEPWLGGYHIVSSRGENPTDITAANQIDEPATYSMRKHLMEITTSIREVDSLHVIAVSGDCLMDCYTELLPPWDDNMMITMQKKSCFNDESSVAPLQEIRERYNLPVWISGLGNNSNVWYTQAVALMEREDIGWSLVSLKNFNTGGVLGVSVNPGYRKMLKYWAGLSEKPTRAEAGKALLQLAADVKLENCRVHKDVIDAVFRQVRSSHTRPFTSDAFAGNFMIRAVAYDFGRNGRAYFDRDSADYRASTGQAGVGNSGLIFRNDGVDIAREKSGDFYVTNIETGEWLQYTFHLVEEGNYRIGLTVSSDRHNSRKGKITVEINGEEIRNTGLVPHTSDDENWTTIDIRNVRLRRDTNVLRIRAKQGGFNLRAISFTQADGTFITLR